MIFTYTYCFDISLLSTQVYMNILHLLSYIHNYNIHGYISVHIQFPSILLHSNHISLLPISLQSVFVLSSDEFYRSIFLACYIHYNIHGYIYVDILFPSIPIHIDHICFLSIFVLLVRIYRYKFHPHCYIHYFYSQDYISVDNQFPSILSYRHHISVPSIMIYRSRFRPLCYNHYYNSQNCTDFCSPAPNGLCHMLK